MEDDNIEDISSHPFFVRAEFPFVFIPTTGRTGFTFTDSHSDVFNSDDQTTSEFLNEKEETIDDEVDQNEENNDNTEEKNDLRISQPKYSQLLKELDFSHTRMVDVTNLLSDEASNYLTPDENENQKKISNDENLSETIDHQSLSNSDNNNQIKENEILINDLNNLPTIIQEESQITTEKFLISDKHSLEDDDDTSKQTIQNSDLNEQEDITTSKSNKNPRFTTQHSNNIQDDNLSSIPRLNTNNHTENQDQVQEHLLNWDDLINGIDAFIPPPPLIYSQPINETQATPIKSQTLSSPEEKPKQNINSSSKQRINYRLRQLSTSSDTDSIVEQTLHRPKQKQHSISQPQLSIDEDYNDLNTHLKQAFLNKDRPCTTASDILLRRLSNQQLDQTNSNKKKSHHHHHRSSTSRHNGHEDNIQSTKVNDTWLSMLGKLEREHKERLENQQKQYENYMHDLEEKMKRRFDEYLSLNNSLQESKSETLDESMHLRHNHKSVPIDSNTEKYKTYSNSYQYRPLAKNLNNNNNNYPSNSTTQLLTSDKRQLNGTNLSKSQSREDISNLREELSTKHAKHISNLKLYYEHELDELKNQLNRSRMGHTSSITRQSMETIERINSENIRLHDEMKDLRHTLKMTEEENNSLKRQIDELHDQLNNKDQELKNYHRSLSDLEQKLKEAHNIKERQDEKFRHTDRQALIYREENEKITNDLQLTRERLQRLEERYTELENEINKPFRQKLFPNENNNQRVTDDMKFNSTMALNMPTSREYGRFTLTTSKYSSSTVTTPRDGNLDSSRYTSNGSDNLFRHGNSPRPLTKITDYINEKPAFPQPYVPPSRPLYSPRKPSPNRHRIEQMPVRDSVDNQIKQSEQLEEKFDELLKKKRDLESRINRIPLRGLTNTDRQLLDVLEREIERVEQQISSVKLELRKMNILRTH